MPRSSFTSQSAPTPRQSHWNTPVAAPIALRSSAGFSVSSRPSVSRIAWRCAVSTVPNSAIAARSHRPIAVPPAGSR